MFSVFGHDHKAHTERVGKTLIINPGSLVGVYLPNKQAPITFALYDTQTDQAELVKL